MTFQPVSESHFSLYAARMAQSLGDKLFFADRLQADVVVDFGCADGALLAGLSAFRAEIQLVGYDLCKMAVARARQTVPHGAFFADWAEMEDHLRQFRGARIALVASSLLHEVYAYGGETEGDLFWHRLHKGPFSHFVLRDMSISEADVARPDLERVALVRANADPRVLHDFEEHWGRIEEVGRLAHFLLKYRYQDNWSRELPENYLPITRERILQRLSPAFEIEFISHEVLPFLETQAQSDLGVGFPCPTHLKLIVRRR